MRPGLGAGNYDITSGRDPNYNCVAWVLEDQERWWWPAPGPAGMQQGGYHWPDEVPGTATAAAFVRLFERFGYEDCGTDITHEPGVDKVAIFEHDGVIEHVARQLPNGWWTSKLGEFWDIVHARPHNIAGAPFGDIVRVMRRPITPTV